MLVAYVFSKLPVRQLTIKQLDLTLTPISKLPVRQLTLFVLAEHL